MDKLLTTEEVARHLHLHQNTVIRYIRDGRLLATKVGNAYRIKESVLATFVGEAAALGTDARVICVSNQKGGVAKTTTAVNLAASLGATGKKILLVDLDPQGGCAICLGMDTSSPQRTVYDVLVHTGMDLSNYPKVTYRLSPEAVEAIDDAKRILRRQHHVKVSLKEIAEEAILAAYRDLLANPHTSILVNKFAGKPVGHQARIAAIQKPNSPVVS